MAASRVDVPEATMAASAASNARRGLVFSNKIFLGICIESIFTLGAIPNTI